MLPLCLESKEAKEQKAVATKYLLHSRYLVAGTSSVLTHLPCLVWLKWTRGRFSTLVWFLLGRCDHCNVCVQIRATILRTSSGGDAVSMNSRAACFLVTTQTRSDHCPQLWAKTDQTSAISKQVMDHSLSYWTVIFPTKILCKNKS